MATVSTKRLRDDLVALSHGGVTVADFSRRAARLVARAVPFDGFCMLTLDPATHLPTSEVVENGLPDAVIPHMAALEVRGEDFNTFADLGRSGRVAATLSDATGGDLDRSVRHRELKRPHGFGDELRAALVGESATWGALTLLRGSDVARFTPAEAVLVGSIAPHIAEGLRKAMLLSAPPAKRLDHGREAGLALVAPDNSIAMADAAAEGWLDELRDGASGDSLPPVLASVASRARSIASGRASGEDKASVRLRTASGVWLIVRGSTLGDDPDSQTALIIEPARSHELAPLIADAYGLTERERAVTQLVAQGLDTNAIGERLYISPWTVQDHLKSIFEKTGVSTRGELTARMFFDHYAPRLTDGSPIGSDGWFAPSLND